MIILDLQNNTAEHLEPHGNEFRGGEKLKGLDFMIEKELPKIFRFVICRTKEIKI